MDTASNTKLGNVNDLPVGDMHAVKMGDREILLIRLDTGIYAMDNFCTHGACRLANGKLEGGTLRCLCHGSEFNVKTGEVVNGPATTPQPTFAVVLKNGEISLAP